MCVCVVYKCVHGRKWEWRCKEIVCVCVGAGVHMLEDVWRGEDSLQILFLTFLPCLNKVSAPCVLVSWPQSFWSLDTHPDPGCDMDSGASNSDHHA